VLQIDTYRYYGHSVADANAKKYREVEEIEKYKKFHDPLQLWQKSLIEEGIINEEQIAALDANAKVEADDAVTFAGESPVPAEAEMFSDVYYEVDRQTLAGRTGKHFFND